MDNRTTIFNALRAEIVTWIVVEYTMIGAAVGTMGLALTVYKPPAGFAWPYFSASMVILLSCFMGLISFARLKIMMASAYIMVNLREFAEWDWMLMRLAELNEIPEVKEHPVL